MNVLALVPYPEAAASTRFRLVQLLPRLRAAGIEVAVRPFLDPATYGSLYDRRAAGRTCLGLLRGAARRVGDVVRARRADAVLVLREAMILGPPVVEMLSTAVGRCPLVLDLDDPTWVGYDSPTYGAWGRAFKWPGKALTLIDRASVVTCGSRAVADFVTGRGGRAVVVPPVVDTDSFRPRPPGRLAGGLPVVGWIGTHSTAPYLQQIAPTLAAVARTHPFRLRVVGARPATVAVPGVAVESLDWSLPSEPQDFASLDVGLYPLPDDDRWAAGKAGLKSVQYLACGVPFVASPVGGAAELGVAGRTHLLAASPEEWRQALTTLLADETARAGMADCGRQHALAHHTTDIGGALLAGALRSAIA